MSAQLAFALLLLVAILLLLIAALSPGVREVGALVVRVTRGYIMHHRGHHLADFRTWLLVILLCIFALIICLYPVLHLMAHPWRDESSRTVDRDDDETPTPSRAFPAQHTQPRRRLVQHEQPQLRRHQQQAQQWSEPQQQYNIRSTREFGRVHLPAPPRQPQGRPFTQGPAGPLHGGNRAGGA